MTRPKKPPIFFAFDFPGLFPQGTQLFRHTFIFFYQFFFYKNNIIIFNNIRVLTIDSSIFALEGSRMGGGGPPAAHGDPETP